ncbi:MAG: pyrroline-5-carboxylate reductase [Pirellulaceae bacterium]|nr:pyrroline-5-carboxylate reductase [Planctomycetales bacterium]
MTAAELASIRIGFIGAGQMARALACGFVGSGLVEGDQLRAADTVAAAVEGLKSLVTGANSVRDNVQLVRDSDIVFIAVKPQQLSTALAGLTAADVVGTLFVSIVAGTRIDELARLLHSRRVIRVMPNTPSLVGCGAAAISRGERVSNDDADKVRTLLEAVGIVVELDEKQLDAVTGLSGSGPAFVYQFIEALSDGGVRMGLPRDVALQLAAQTVAGAAQMVLQTGEHPAVLKDRVASPAGTTIAGIAELERMGMRGAVIGAVEAATRRATELGG